MPRRELKNANLPPPRGYSRAISTRPHTLIVTSMTAPVDEAGAVVGVGDARAQAERVLVNLRDILEQNGASLNDVVRVSAYVTRQADAGAVMEAIAAAFDPPHPAIALAVITGLPNPDFLVEIEATASLES